MDHRPRRSVDHVEVIEHHIIEEGRRPIGGALPLPPYSALRTARDSFEVRGDPFADRRYDITGERDVSRDASFMHNSANYGQNIEVTPPRGILNTSGPRVEFADTTSNTIINNYGYDVHEVHTSEGGARVVETHGAGPLDSSRLESTRIDEDRPGITSAIRSGFIGGAGRGASSRQASSQQQIFSVPSPPVAKDDGWRQTQSDQEEPFSRKDSYRRMQQAEELMVSKESSQSYAPQSQTSLVTRSSRSAGNRFEEDEEAVGCWARTKYYVLGVIDAIRAEGYSRRLCCNLCVLLLLLLLLIFLLAIILNALFHPYSVSEFLLYPPVCEECRRKNPHLSTAQLPSSLYIHFYSSDQAHFELRGNLPFKSNSFTAIDFQTGFVAIADHALTDQNGIHTTCFLMPLDRTAIGSMEQLKEAVSYSTYEIQAQYGWQEFWNFDAEPIASGVAQSKFTDKIEDCDQAKWYLLKQAVHSRDLDCSDCFDFCLPDWAVVRKEKYEDESTVGVRRLDCFRLYVPEWRNYRVETDISGGHWNYPLMSESTKRDGYRNWENWISTGKVTSVDRKRRRVEQLS